MKSRLVSMHCREADGSLHLVDHVYKFSLTERKNPEMPEDRFCSGGGGCFGVLVEYCSKYLVSERIATRFIDSRY